MIKKSPFAFFFSGGQFKISGVDLVFSATGIYEVARYELLTRSLFFPLVVAEPLWYQQRRKTRTKNVVATMAGQRLDELILAETREVKKRQRQRRSGLRHGPGRPDFADLGASTGKTSPLPAIGRSSSTGNLGASTKRPGHGRGSQSMATLPGAGVNDGDDTEDETSKYTGRVEVLQTEVRSLRTQYNGLRDTHRRLRSQISDYSHKLNYLKREDDVEENRRLGMEQIEKQRRELDKAKKMLENTLNYRRTLNFMTNRLKEERLTYDNTLKAYEEALEVRRAEGAEVRALASEVRMAKTQEERELARLKQLVNKERVYWEQQVEERRREARKREEQKRWAEERKRKEDEEEDGAEGKDGEGKESSGGQRSTKLHIISTKKLDLNALRTKVDEYSRAFTEIRLATGLNNVDDMIERYNQHTSHTEEMDAQIAEIRSEVERLTDRRGEMQRRLEAIKFSGAGTKDFNHDMIDKLSREGDEARRKLKIIKEEHEKVEKMNLEVRQSIDAMARKLSSVSIETPTGVVSGAMSITDIDAMEQKGASSSSVGDDHGVTRTIKLIGLIEERMTQLMEVLDAGGDAAGDRSGDASGAGSSSDLQNIMETLLSKNKYNVRIRPRTPTSKEHLLLRGAGLSASTNARPSSRADNKDKGAQAKKDNADGIRSRRGAAAPSES